MKKMYNEPLCEVIKIETTDVIATSAGGGGVPPTPKAVSASALEINEYIDIFGN